MDVTQELELSLIGSLIMYPDKMVTVSSIVDTEDFSSPKAREAYGIISSLWGHKQEVSITSILANGLSCAAFAAQSIEKASPIGIEGLADSVAQNAKSRRICADLKKAMSPSLKPKEKLSCLLETYNREIAIETKDANISSVISRFDKNVESTKKQGAGFSTGFKFLDEAYVKYVPGHIWTMGAFTSIGKTAVMVQKICNLILSEKCPKIIVISTEMTEDQLISRILANMTGVHSQRILAGNYRSGEEENVMYYKDIIRSMPISIFDDVYFTDDIETVFHKADLQGGVDIGFIDYVQNCRVRNAINEYQAQSTMAKDLQKMAKDVRCTLVCLSQVSNDVGRGNTDNLELKGAGEWAAVSDVGIMLTRKKDAKHLMRYSVKKNRHGALLDMELEYKMDYTRLQLNKRIE